LNSGRNTRNAWHSKTFRGHAIASDMASDNPEAVHSERKLDQRSGCSDFISSSPPNKRRQPNSEIERKRARRFVLSVDARQTCRITHIDSIDLSETGNPRFN